MGSRNTEERNEKIIRGLMKLPPNRRCINCNSLGPQYVCTNFWTFVCITCSGIHREFTHRVKSVSMSKFTSEEVEALQKGGNQRARETFLNDWNPQSERFPDSSNADKVREFIKNVYVDRKYSGGRTSDKPPSGMQDLKSHEDEARRANSYHSYSQSPPYDYQYEERLYGKQAFAVTRREGSDRGLNTSTLSSPSYSNDHIYEDNFVPERSKSSASVFSVDDAFKSDTQSPSSQRDIGICSPSTETSMDTVSEDISHTKMNTYFNTCANRDMDQVPYSQRTANTSSFGSFNSNSVSFKSVNSKNAVDVALEPEESAGMRHSKLASFLSLPPLSVYRNSESLDLFNTPFTPQSVTFSASAPDLFQLPTTSDFSVDLFHPSSISPLPLFFDVPQQQSVAFLQENSSNTFIQNNEGWATFDVPQYVEPSQGIQNSTAATISPTEGESLNKLDEQLSQNTTPEWSSFHDSDAHECHSSIPDQWQVLHNVALTLDAGSNQAGALSHPTDVKSTNPFDFPYDSDNVFLDMRSLQDVLPNGQMTDFVGVPEPWFAQNILTPYTAAGPQGALELLGGPTPSAQILTVQPQETVGTIGGNPFD